jgi:hypothetical protein
LQAENDGVGAGNSSIGELANKTESETLCKAFDRGSLAFVL